MKRSAPLTRRKRLNPRSKKRRLIAPLRAAFVAEQLARRPLCEVRAEGCWKRAQSVHEIKRRSHGGEILPGPKAEAQGQRFVSVCVPCHDRITFNPAWAAANGWEIP